MQLTVAHGCPSCPESSVFLGDEVTEARFVWQWLLCQQCGFLRRKVTRVLSDFPEVDLHRLRNSFQVMFEKRGKGNRCAD